MLVVLCIEAQGTCGRKAVGASPISLFRWFSKRFLTVEQQEEVGVLSAEAKARLAAGYSSGGTAPAASPWRSSRCHLRDLRTGVR
jgi:hypothetical protein